MHPKLAHLSEDQLQEIIARYYDQEREFTVSQIVRDFEIDARPGELSSLLPEHVHDETCSFCEGIHLQSKAPPRTGPHRREPRCPSCGHRPGGYCNCANCREAAATAKAESERIRRDLIHEHYGPHNWGEPKPAAELSLREAVYLKALISHYSTEDLEFVDPAHFTQVPFAPNSELMWSVLRHVYFNTFTIAPCPDSPIEGYAFGEEGEAPRFYWSRVDIRLFPRLTEPERRSYLKDLDKRLNSLSFDADVMTEEWKLWVELIKSEALEYYQAKLNEIGVEFDELGDRTDSVFENLAERFPLSKIYHIVFATIKNTHHFIAQKRIARRNWKSVYVGAVERNADRYEAQGWLKDYRRDYGLPQSTLSATYFNSYLGIGDDYFFTSPPENPGV